PSTTAVPTFTPSPITPTLTPAPTGEVKHTVQVGENLFRIALRYGTTVATIASANGIANPAMIYVGQELTISSSGATQPPPTGGTTYVVQIGDNLFRIALRYNMSYIALAQHNGIANPASIYVGQAIRIP
ncbi:MAG: LysM domain-containing protein, partial [Anaerolineae bacterium]